MGKTRRRKKIISGLVVAVSGLWMAVAAAAAPAPVAVFPLQELGRGGSDVNLPLTRWLAEQLAAGGNEITPPETVISFMAHNRIRTVGYLESFHLFRVGEELGASFVLLGTVSQLKEQPIPSLGLTLQLVRTSDARTVWSYTGHLSSADARRVLAIGEPKTVADLQPLLLADLLAAWPWAILQEPPPATAIHIDSIMLRSEHVRPGDEVYIKVRLRDQWPAGRAPRVFFQADDQVHAATPTADGGYEAAWVAGEKDGRFPVTLLLEWPLYGRRETALLGAYVVDGATPLLELELRGARTETEMPMFRDRLLILPRLLVPKPLAGWRLSFEDESGRTVGVLEESGNLPKVFIWQGRGNEGPLYSGVYRVVVEARDRAGNSASASGPVELQRLAPEVGLTLARAGRELQLDLRHDGRVPLDFWRLEMWTQEGRLLKTAEGRELPARVDFELPPGEEEGAAAEIQGRLVVRDMLGNLARRDLADFFLAAAGRRPVQPEEEKKRGISETWVDEF